MRVRPSVAGPVRPSWLVRDQGECERDDLREMSEVPRRPPELLGALLDMRRPLKEAEEL